MKIYNYTKDTKEFIAESTARVNPLEQGEYLIPANATSKQVIEVNQGFARCFIDNNWTYIEDNRGQYKVTNYSPLELKLITDLGIIDNKASDLDTKEDGSYYTYYNENGTVDAITQATQDELELIALYKSYYLEVFNAKLKELDYDDIATVGVWAIKDGSSFQAEAKALLNWYEAIINKNYEILNAVKARTISTPTKEGYLLELPLYETFKV